MAMRRAGSARDSATSRVVLPAPAHAIRTRFLVKRPCDVRRHCPLSGGMEELERAVGLIAVHVSEQGGVVRMVGPKDRVQQRSGVGAQQLRLECPTVLIVIEANRDARTCFV